MSKLVRPWPAISVATTFLFGCGSADDVPEFGRDPGGRVLTVTPPGGIGAIDTCAAASAMNIKVPAQCATISAAIARAKTGATITIAAGTYKEAVVLDKSLTLTGAGSGTTRIVAPKVSDTVLHLGPGGGGKISKVTLSGGHESMSAGEFGITGTLYLPAAVTLSDVVLGNAPLGITGHYGSLSLTNVTVSNATTAGTKILRASSVTVSNSAFTNNAGPGLGIALSGSIASIITIADSSFNNNGVGLSVSGKGATVTVGSSTVANNKGVGIELSGVDGSFKMSSLLVKQNALSGVRVALGNGNVTLVGSTLLNNVANGLAVAGGSHRIDLGTSVIKGNGAAGVVVSQSSTKPIFLENIEIANPGSVGIRVSGAGLGSIYKSWIHGAREAGIDLAATGETWISNVKVEGTLPNPSTGMYGDGVRVVATNVHMDTMIVRKNARAGVSEFGCGDIGSPNGARLSVSNTTFQCNAFDIDREMATALLGTCPSGGTLPALLDQGATWCTAQCDPTEPVPAPIAPEDECVDYADAPPCPQPPPSDWARCHAVSANGLTPIVAPNP